MGDRIIITTEGETLDIKIMIGIGVGHMKGRREIGGMIEALVTVDQGQVQGQLQIGIELDPLNIENMTFCKGLSDYAGKWRSRRNPTSNRCSIWMRIKQYYKPHWWM